MAMKESAACVYIEDISKHLDSMLSKLPNRDQGFILVDLNENALYTPKIGFYECKDLSSLKMLVQKLLEELNVDRIYVGKGIDEKWLEEHLYMLLNTRNPSNVNPILLGKVLNVIPVKRRHLLLKTRVDTTLILNVIEAYSKI